MAARVLRAISNLSIDFLLDDAATDLIAERIDLALRTGIATGSGFTVRRLAPNPMILAASPAYLERHPAPRRLRALAQHDCLTLSNRHGRNTWRLQGPRGSQEVSINSRLAANDIRVLMQACKAGLGRTHPFHGCDGGSNPPGDATSCASVRSAS